MNPEPPEGGHDSPRAVITSGRTIDAFARQGFDHLGQASIGDINPLPGVHGSLSRQDSIPLNQQEGEKTHGSIAETSNLSSAAYFTEAIGGDFAPLFINPDNGFATGIGGGYAPFFRNPVDGFVTDMNDDYATCFRPSEVRITTNSGNYDAKGFAQLYNTGRTDQVFLRNWSSML